MEMGRWRPWDAWAPDLDAPLPHQWPPYESLAAGPVAGAWLRLAEAVDSGRLPLRDAVRFTPMGDGDR